MRHTDDGSRLAWATVAIFLLALGLPYIAYAARTPPTNPASVTLDARAIAETDGWCVSGVGTTATDLMASIPARITTAERSRVLYTSVRYIDDGGTETRACVVTGPTSPPALPCNALDADAAGVMFDQEVKTYHTLPDSAGALPSVFASVDADTGTFCVEVGY